MKKKKLVSLFIQLAFLSAAFGQGMVSGYVFDDANKNGVKDKREMGLPNVSVSNGVEVVVTDKKGFYSLPASQDMIVSVIKPAGYAVPLNKDSQPLFYYIHKPKGSPTNNYGGVSPTGQLPTSVDFPLLKSFEKPEFTVLLFGDPQAGDMTNAMYYEKAIIGELMGVQDVAFGISLGDLGAKELFGTYIHSTGKLGVPWYNVFGNHDMNDGKLDELTDETYELYFGPPNYAFNYANAHFIMLDDVLYPNPISGSGYLGGFREDILEFIENDLKHVPKDKLIVLGFHIPIYEFEPGPDQFREGDVQKLFDLLEGYQYTLSISGHTHSQNHHFFTKDEGWNNLIPHHHYNPGAVSGDVYKGPKDVYDTPASFMRDGTPKGYGFLYVNGTDYTYEYKVAGEPVDYKMSVHLPKIVPHVKKYRGEIVVNFFQGTPLDSVQYRVDDGEWDDLTLTSRSDKYLLDLQYEWDHAETLPWGIRLSTPLPCSHIWSKQIPASVSLLDLGEHTLEVRAKDWLGRTYTTSKKFKIVPDHPYLNE